MIPASVLMLKKGAAVRVRRDERDDWTTGTVAMISENGVSLGLMLDSPIRAGGGVLVGVLLLLIDHEADTVTGPCGDDYQIERRMARQ